MSNKQEVLATIAAEKAEADAALAVRDAKLADLQTQVTDLQAKLDAGGAVTADDLSEINDAVKGIITPSAA